MKLNSLCIVVVLLGFAAGCSKAPAPETVAAPEPVEAPAAPEVAPEVPVAPAPAPVAAAPIAPVVEVPEDSDVEMTNVVIDLAAGETPVLEVQIYQIVTSDQGPREKAQELLSMFPRLEPDLQRKVALAAVRQVGDTNYDVLRDHLFDVTLDTKVLNVFMTDMLKRTPPVKFPTLVDLARTDGHPMQKQSWEQLRTQLGVDYGTNWSRWEYAVEMRLAGGAN